MPNLAKIGQRLNGHERTWFLMIWLRESLRHLHRPPRSRGQVIPRPLRGTLPNSLTRAISTLLLLKILESDPKKFFSYIFVKGLMANFEFGSAQPKFLLINLNFQSLTNQAIRLLGKVPLRGLGMTCPLDRGGLWRCRRDSRSQIMKIHVRSCPFRRWPILAKFGIFGQFGIWHLK